MGSNPSRALQGRTVRQNLLRHFSSKALLVGPTVSTAYRDVKVPMVYRDRERDVQGQLATLVAAGVERD